MYIYGFEYMNKWGDQSFARNN